MSNEYGKSDKQCFECSKKLIITGIGINGMSLECEKCKSQYEINRTGSDPGIPNEENLRKTGGGDKW